MSPIEEDTVGIGYLHHAERAAEKKINELKAEVAQWIKTNDQNCDTKDAYKRQLVQAKAEVARLTAKLEGKEKELASIEAVMDSINTESKALRERIGNVEWFKELVREAIVLGNGSLKVTAPCQAGPSSKKQDGGK